MDVQRRLRELITYEPVTGEFLDKKGNPKGHIQRSNGRRYIYFDGKKTLACRVAYLWIKGEWPPFNLTHRNGDRSDDRWVNLKPRSDTQFFKSVKYEAEGQYIAQICVMGNLHFLGYFRESRDARAAVRRASTPPNFFQYLPEDVQRRELNRPRWA